MKKRKTALLAFSLITLTTLGGCGLTSCGGGEVSTVSTVVITGVKNGVVGDTIQLSATVFGTSSNEVTWKSSDVAIATVSDSGLVTLVSGGSVTITATSKENPDITSSPAHISVFEDGEMHLEVSSLPTKTKYKVGDKLSYDGISIMAYSYVDGVKDTTSAEILSKSDVTFSEVEGVTLSEKGNKVITVSKNGCVSTSFSVTVGETVEEKKLYVSSLPNTTTYTLTASKESEEKTAKFSSRGLSVQELTYVDGDLNGTRNLSSSDYTLSLLDGATLTQEGLTRVEVTSKTSGVESTSFNIMVYTEDTTVYDIFKTLQQTHNYTAEVFNNVGTTADVTGFHYLRRYTEGYYDEIEYQNVKNGTEIVFDTTGAPKSHLGYTSYKDATTSEEGILQYSYDIYGEPVADSIVSTGYDSWWDKASSVARLFTLFKLSDIPTQTLNGRYLTTVIDVVDGDDEMGTQTAEKYPLVASFLDYCGWSSSLITIMNRFTISFNDDGNLELRADFGSYGYTSLVISDIGTTSIPEVEVKLPTLQSAAPAKVINPAVQTIANIFKTNNYTRFEYGDNGVNKNNPFGYYNPEYYYSVMDGVGYAKIDANGKSYAQKFNGGANGTTFTAVGNLVELTDKDFYDYVGDEAAGNNVQGYVGNEMSNTFGSEDNPQGLLYTFSRYDGLSSDTMVTYQSFDDNALQDLVDYIGGGETNEFRFWLMTTYKQFVDDTSYTNMNNIDTIEVWDINAVTLSGFVMAFGDFGSTSIDWIENGIASIENANAAQQAAALK